jgi:ion channel/pentapeptide repeat protein
MNDSVAVLRARWTPELTDAAIRFLQGNPGDIDIPTMELDGATLLDLRGIRIHGTQLDGMLIRKVNFRWATIEDVGFKGARLVDCNLSQASFAHCYFRRTAFQNCDIVNSKFESCEFPNARFEASRLDFASFRSCEIEIDSIAFPQGASPHVLARICRNLKLNAMAMGHFLDASELAYRERTYERHMLHRRAFPRPGEPVRGRLHAMAMWLDSLLFNWLWGYGERPWRLVPSMLFMILAFGTLQYALDGIPGRGWWEHVYFSGITFCSVGYGDLVPEQPIPRTLAITEGILGITFLGLLIASATKRIMTR